MTDIYDIVVEYRIEFPNDKEPIEGRMNTIANSDYDAENWARDFWEKRYPTAYVKTNAVGNDDDPFILP